MRSFALMLFLGKDEHRNMALKFRLKNLAETFLEQICCPGCGTQGPDDEHFSTEFTKVTYQGIVVIAHCKECGEIFLPVNQRLGVINNSELKQAVDRDSKETGEPVYNGLAEMSVRAERLNAERKDQIQ